MMLMLITLFHAYQNDFFTDGTKRFASGSGYLLLFFGIFYVGTRPVSEIFVDMMNYSLIYNRVVAGEKPIIKNDYLFNYFMVFCTKLMSDRSFFFLCNLIYAIPCYIFSKKYSGSYWYYVFFIFLGSFMYWPFATNGIRNGLGTAIFIFGLCFYERKIPMYALMAVAFGMHNSLIIPIAGFVIAGIYKNPKIYLYIWLAAIPLSLIGGGFWESLFGGLGFGDDTRAADYLTKGNVNKDTFAYTGFRWDFLFYSSFAVFAGWYFIFKKNITDKFYIHLWGTYMIANAFWILVIRANFSNRFAYLSWFLMAPVIAYPLLRYKMFPNQYRVVGVVIAIYYLFTYFMFLRG
ncbi:hypothetical protein ACM44_12385 [Chryseobacterium koreense CCUG 49689]|uniref:EpsG family protein n=2 Tax=Chryseobacterium koreense TaxID=232216 RepID=A0A0J7IWU7_9FLAO|nr:EpsG family protein [Chryseobacterium koreense]KMQ70437.1 hypothetical protein ACM44_12385 [Chryseobacterium koreense CCUG 49689]